MFVQSSNSSAATTATPRTSPSTGRSSSPPPDKLAKMNLKSSHASGKPRRSPCRYLFQGSTPRPQGRLHHGQPALQPQGLAGRRRATADPRWGGYDTPPTGNANYAWILHMLAKLSEHGTAGIVLANRSMSTDTTGQGFFAIRKKLLENDLVDCMIALPGQLFFLNRRLPLVSIIKEQTRRQKWHKQCEPDPLHRRPQNRLHDQPYPEGTERRRHRRHCQDLPRLAIRNRRHLRRCCRLLQVRQPRRNSEARLLYSPPGAMWPRLRFEDDGIPIETKLTELKPNALRSDGEIQPTRSVIRKNLEILGVWRVSGHLHQTPDSFALIFLHGGTKPKILPRQVIIGVENTLGW